MKKFRVWDIKNKSFLDKNRTEFALLSNGHLIISESDWYKDLSNANDCDYVVQLYTGLKDKNNKEIFEGDILNVLDCHKETIIGEIIWGRYEDSEYIENKSLETWIFKSFDNTPISCIINDVGVRFNRGLEIEPNSAEIIGNIFENSDLLNKK